MTGAAFNTGKSKQDYGTPWEFIRAVEARFGPITFDLAAHAGNAKHFFYYTEEEDSLAQDWHLLEGNLWLNPEFRKITPWAAKCAAECALGARVPFLVPASVGSNWFADHVYGHALVLPVRPRLSFDGKSPYPKDMMLCMYGETPGFEPWKWNQ